MKAAILCLACTLVLALAAPKRGRSDYAIKESHVVPTKWHRLHRAEKDHIIQLRIALRQKSFAELERHLYEVSDPDHERYGQHLSNTDIHRLIAPAADSLDSVHDWLKENGVDLDDVRHSPAKDWLTIDMPVADIERLLNTEYNVYQNYEGSRLVRTPQYSLPIALHDHIDLIQPTNYFGDPKAMRRPFKIASIEPQPANTLQRISLTDALLASDRTISSVCNESAVTNLCLRTLYNTIEYIPQVPQLNRVGMTAYLNETANITDFRIFMSQQRPDANPDYLYNYTTINGGANDQTQVPKSLYGQIDVEANLDSQTIGGFVYPTEFQVYSTGGTAPFKKDKSTQQDTNEPYLDWLHYVLSLKNPPHTISTSYGDDEQTVPYSYAKRVCEEMAQLGAKGVSLLFSAGDGGVGTNGTCIANDGSKKRMFIPEFPTSCPYITSVGGTRGFHPEVVAWNDANGYVSGSGLSNYFAQPAYQATVVDKYLKSIGHLHAGLYNTTGRAYPDISAQGYHYTIVYGGQNIRVDGTSAATPCAASIITLLNDVLLAAGKRPLGFLNPFLYKTLHKGFTDITIGSTWGCNTSGFPAAAGWDLASGWGTPDFSKLKELVTGYGESSYRED